MTNKIQETQAAAVRTMDGPEIQRALLRENKEMRAGLQQHAEASRVAKEKAISEFPARMRAKVRVGGLGVFLLGAMGVFVGAFSLGASFVSGFVIVPAVVMALGALIMAAPGLTIKAFQALDYLCDRIMCKKLEPAEGVELTRYRRIVDSDVDARSSLMAGDASAGRSYGATDSTPTPSRGSLGLFPSRKSSVAASERAGLLVRVSSNPSKAAEDGILTLARSSSANRKARG